MDRECRQGIEDQWIGVGLKGGLGWIFRWVLEWNLPFCTVYDVTETQMSYQIGLDTGTKKPFLALFSFQN